MRYLEKTDPVVKLLFCVELIILAFVFNTPIAQSILLLIVVLAELTNSYSLKNFKTLSLIILVVGIQILVIQLLFGREGILIYKIWIFSVYSKSMISALCGVLRTAVLAFSAVLFCTHTDSEDVTLMFVDWAVPYRYAMLAEFTARFLPVIGDEYKCICDAKIVRGEDSSTIIKKLKSLFSSFMPLIYRSLRKAEDAALSMDMRGFGLYATRTFNERKKFYPHKKICIAVLIAMMIIALIIKFIYI